MTQIQNPFRNLIASVEYCPAESRERLLSNVFDEWDDTTHDGNPLDHDIINNPSTLAEYLSWDGNDGDVEDVDACLTWLLDVARAFDLITPMLPPDEFGGQYIDSRYFWGNEGNPWQMPQFNDEYDITFRFNDDTTHTIAVHNHSVYALKD